MQPVRKVLSATHFKYLQDIQKWTPCSPGDPDAQEKSWTDIESDELQEPPLRVADFLKSLDSVRPTVTADDIKKHDAWTLESGRSLHSHPSCRSLNRLLQGTRDINEHEMYYDLLYYCAYPSLVFSGID